MRKQARTTFGQNSMRSHRQPPNTARFAAVAEQLEQRVMLTSAPFDYTPTSVALSSEGTAARAVPFPSRANSTFRDLGDFYWPGNKKVSLLRATDEVLVGLKAGATKSQVQKRLVAARAPLAGFRVVELEPGILLFHRSSGLSLSRLNGIEAKVATTPGVAWTSPTFAESNGSRLRVVNRVFLKLKPGVSPDEFFSKGFASHQRVLPEIYRGTLARGGGLEAIRLVDRLRRDPRVEAVDPDGFFEIHLLGADPTANKASQFSSKNIIC